MRREFRVFVLCLLAAAGMYAATAFDAATTGTRSVEAKVVTDANSYLALAKNNSSPHKDFVDTGNNGEIVVTFDGNGGATGTGVNPNSTYYFDNIINITNKGTKTVSVWANSTTTAGTWVRVCMKAPPNEDMINGCYSATQGPLSVAVGNRLSLGIAVNATGLGSGSAVTGTIEIQADS